MHISKKFFYDRLVLVLLTLNAFFAVVGSIFLLLRLDGGDDGSYIISYRSNLGLDAFRAGTVIDFVYFVALAVLILLFHTYIAMRMYETRKYFAVSVLSLGTLLLALIIIVTNALLVLR
jgi:hypothetical protein